MLECLESGTKHQGCPQYCMVHFRNPVKPGYERGAGENINLVKVSCKEIQSALGFFQVRVKITLSNSYRVRCFTAVNNF